MTDFQSLLDLPFETLAVLAAGYLGYRFAYIGKDATHSSVDVVFMSLVFAFVAKIPLVWMIGHGFSVLFSAVIASGISIATASVWRKWISRWVWKLFRGAGVTASDRHNSAWGTILAHDNKELVQIIVRLKNGDAVMCEKLGEFNSEAFGSCILGADGSVALYVTHRRKRDSGNWTQDNPRWEGWGAAVTYIPSDQISSIELSCLGH